MHLVASGHEKTKYCFKVDFTYSVGLINYRYCNIFTSDKSDFNYGFNFFNQSFTLFAFEQCATPKIRQDRFAFPVSDFAFTFIAAFGFI